MLKNLSKNTLTLMLVCCLASCGSDSESDTTGESGFAWPANTADAVAQYAEIVDASYADSHMTAGALNTSLKTLVMDPTEPNLEAAKQAWLASREPYLQTEVYRFYDGPIDHPEDGPEGLINAWPLDENYIDYVDGMPNAGIINSDGVIDAATLEGLNEQGGEANIATGYHAIEFLLWGQDLSDEGIGGQRPHTDYVTDGTGTAANQDRRGTYLTVVGDMLVDHIASVHGHWMANGEYRADFVASENTADSIRKILTGMIVLSGFETGGERLKAALDSGNRDDEHSCFSDNTHRDMIQDVQGIMNVWKGSYERTNGDMVSGVGVHDVVKEVNADLAARIDTQIQRCLDLANALVVPFENEIVPGNAEGNTRVANLIMGLNDLDDLLFEVFDLFGFDRPNPE